jgi:hypothetical protein
MCEFIEVEKGRGDVSPDVPVIIIWDSISGTPTQPSADALKNKRGTHEAGITVDKVASMSSQLTLALPHIKRYIRRRPTTVIMINQVRDVMEARFGSQLRTPGGHALHHMADVRTQVKKHNHHKGFMGGKNVFLKGDQILGTVASIEATKNKMAPPFKKVSLINWFATGIDNEYSSIVHTIYDLADYEIISPIVKARCEYAGKSWYPQELARAFRDDRELWSEFVEQVKAAQADYDKLITPTSMYGERGTAEAFNETEESDDED